MNPAVDILVKKLVGLVPRLALVLGSGLCGLVPAVLGGMD